MKGWPARPPGDLRDYLAILRHEKELVEVAAPVRSDQEIAEIQRRVAAADGPALLFTSVDGGSTPVAGNLFGSRKRVDLAFGSKAQAAIRGLAQIAEGELPPRAKVLWRQRRSLLAVARAGVRRVRSGPVTEVVEEPRLSAVPLTKLWPEDGSHFITLPLVLTADPATGKKNLGIYRMQRFDDRTTGMHWQIAKGGGFHYARAEKLGQPLAVTVMVGGPPILVLAAASPLPEGVSELLLASLALGRKLPIVRVNGREVVASCEWAFLGKVPPKKRNPEGPFGDHYGYYSLEHPYPVFEIEVVLRRKNPIWPSTVVGKPFQEDYHIGTQIQELFKPLFPLIMPGVRDLHSYGETGFHPLAAAVVSERYHREAMATAFRILGEGQLSLTKCLLLTDTPRDLTDFPGLLTHLLARVRWDRDLFIFSPLSMDTLDYAGPEVNKGSKAIIAGLGEPLRELPVEIPSGLPRWIRDAALFCPGCLVVGGPDYLEEGAFPDRIGALPSLKDFPLIVLCDRPARAAASQIGFLWTTFTRFNPATDIHASGERICNGRIVREGPVVIDARMKPWYPKELFAAPEIAATVSNRWKEYFPGGGVEMGSSDDAHLPPV